jgi:5'-3' exonuclease
MDFSGKRFKSVPPGFFADLMTNYIGEFNVVVAPGEADCYIGEHATTDDYVLSKDSDMLAYVNVENWITIEKNDFYIFKKDQILHSLDFPTYQHLSMLCALLKNDYFSGVKGIGPAKGMKLVRLLNIEGSYSNQRVIVLLILDC